MYVITCVYFGLWSYIVSKHVEWCNVCSITIQIHMYCLYIILLHVYTFNLYLGTEKPERTTREKKVCGHVVASLISGDYCIWGRMYIVKCHYEHIGRACLIGLQSQRTAPLLVNLKLSLSSQTLHAPSHCIAAMYSISPRLRSCMSELTKQDIVYVHTLCLLLK